MRLSPLAPRGTAADAMATEQLAITRGRIYLVGTTIRYQLRSYGRHRDRCCLAGVGRVRIRREGVTRKACRRPACPVSELKITLFSSPKNEDCKNLSANEASAVSGRIKKSGGSFAGKEVHPVVGDIKARRRMNLLTSEYEYSSRYEFPYSKI